MLISKLKCPLCDYKSEAFGDTCDVHDQSYSFVFQDQSTNEIWVEEVASTRLKELSIDLNAKDAKAKLHRSFSTAQKRLIEIPIGQQDVEVDAVCPKCGHSVLTKVVIGLQ